MRGTSLPFLGLALVITIAWVASPVIAQQMPSMPGPRTIIAGKSLAGIAIGSSIDAVAARFGAPSAVLETDRDLVYVWHRFGVNAYVREGVVTAVSTSNSLMRAGEVGPGFRVDDAIRVFGATYQRGSVEGFQGLQFDEMGIAFGIDRKSVAVIVVFSPGQAAQVSGLQRTAKFAPTAVAPASLGAAPSASPAQVAPPPILPAAPVAQVLAGLPFLSTQRAFSTVTNYMSLSGYLRWVVYQSSATWITVSEASRMVREQRTNAAEQPKNAVPPQLTIIQEPQPTTGQEHPATTIQQQPTNVVPEPQTTTVQQGE
jgi:hypothetical protein